MRGNRVGCIAKGIAFVVLAGTMLVLLSAAEQYRKDRECMCEQLDREALTRAQEFVRPDGGGWAATVTEDESAPLTGGGPLSVGKERLYGGEPELFPPNTNAVALVQMPKREETQSDHDDRVAQEKARRRQEAAMAVEEALDCERGKKR